MIDFINGTTMGVFVATVIFVWSPGPGIMAMLARSMTYGFGGGFSLGLGTAMGDLFYVIVVLFSLSSFIDAMAPYLPYVRWAGACYLAYLGIVQFRTQGLKMEKTEKKSLLKTWTLGVVIAITNPKVMVYYFGFFPLFLHDTPATTQGVMPLFWAWLAGMVFAIVSFNLFAHYLGRMMTNPNTMTVMNRVLGILMVGVALVLVL